MNSKERVLKAFCHQEPDRVPLGEVHIMSSVASELLGREAITGEGGWTIRKQMQLLHTGQRQEYVDRLKVDTLDAYRAAGMDVIHTEMDPPTDSATTYKDISETGWTAVNEVSGIWARFAYSEVSDTAHEVDGSEKQDEGFLAVEKHLDALEGNNFFIDDGCFESTGYVRAQAPELFVMAKVPNLIPSNHGWYPNFMEMMYLEPELTQRLCDVYLKRGLYVVEKYLDLGVDCVLIATDWAYNNGPIFSVEKIRELLIPPVKAIVEYAHKRGAKVLKHTDGNIMFFADEFFAMGIDAFQGIEPNAGMDIGVIKRTYGDKVTLMGNVDCGRTLPFGTKEDIIAETKGCIKAAAKGGGYIMSSSNTIAYPITAERFKIMVDTARQYGQYPIAEF